MILEFEVENFRSINTPIVLSFINGKPRNKRERLSELPKILKTKRILPIGMILGGNASGKSNILQALLTLKKIVTLGSPEAQANLPYDPFLLGDKHNEPTHFSISVLTDEDNIYRYDIAYNASKIFSESLTLIKASKESTLFSRKHTDVGQQINTGGLVTPNEDKAEAGFLQYVAQGTRNEQPFLTEAILKGVPGTSTVREWFRRNMEYISPDHRPHGIVSLTRQNSSFKDYLETQTRAADLGVAKLFIDKTPIEASQHLSPSQKKELKGKLKDKEQVVMSTHADQSPLGGDFLLVENRDGQCCVYRLVLGHSNASGSPIRFDHFQESDGTRRLMELLVAFYELELSDSSRVIIIDELDRSLHPYVTRLLIDRFLSKAGPDRRAQLLFTTHDISLLEEDLFRHDEIWFTEKNSNLGNTELFSLSEVNLRSNKRIMNAYLTGTLGGVPKTAQVEAY